MDVRIVIVAAALWFAPVLLSNANAQDKPEDYAVAIKANCGKELKAQCQGVKDGKARLLACLYAHEDRLSKRCGQTVVVSLTRLGIMLGALANVQRVCEPEVKRLCDGVIAGNGNLIGCLSAKRKEVSEQCNLALDAAFLRPD
jgi:hypothetical protein